MLETRACHIRSYDIMTFAVAYNQSALKGHDDHFLGYRRNGIDAEYTGVVQ